MKVAILGTGAIGLGSAAFLARAGHAPVLWAPRGNVSALREAGAVTAAGAVEGRFAVPLAASAAEAIDGADAVLIAVTGDGHRAVMDAAARHIAPGQTIVVSSMASFSALYLDRLLAARGVSAPIAALGSTVLTGRRSAAAVQVATIRDRLDLAVLPKAREVEALALVETLFGPRFDILPDVLAVGLANLNPVAHLGLVLGNFTRIERGEAWPQYQHLTEAVARLIEALDAERLGLAARLGYAVRDVRRHFRLSFGLPDVPLAEMARLLHARRGGPPGPAALDTRYIGEDLPFGIWPTLALARRAGLDLPLHAAGLALVGALTGRDFAAENDLLPRTGILDAPLEEIARMAREGWPRG